MADMKKILIILISGLLIPSALMAEKGELAYNNALPGPGTVELEPTISYNGWEYLVRKLLADGIPLETVNKIYLDKRMPPVDVVHFKLNPKESKSMYSTFKNRSLLGNIRRYLKTNKRIFDAAERIYKVNRNVIASIMFVESHFGENTGKHLIIERLSRVGSIANPANVRANYEKLLKEDPGVTYKEVEDRALYLENTFYPEILALIKVAEINQIDVLRIKGSYAGAFGIPQFLPSTYINFAVDGDSDGRRSLFSRADAALSVANYLSHSGWKDHATQKEKEAVIWKYNRSEPYIDAVLFLTNELSRN